MDIYAEEGTKVLVTEDSIKNGYYYVEEHARKFLKVGKTYTIEFTEVGGWNTDVYLKEFQDEVFNSVSFEDIVIKCSNCGDTGRGKPTLQDPDGEECKECF